jgi:RNA polymerase sigma-70 factor (ECF subfamily)
MRALFERHKVPRGLENERERTVVLLTFYGDRSSREIAQTLGISEGNVRVIRARAIDRLRACMGPAERAS